MRPAVNSARRKIGQLLPGITLYRAPRFLGMTGKAPDAPCKRRRAGSIPAFSTGTSRKGQRPAFGRRQTGFESLRPDHESLAQSAERRVEAPQVAGSIPAGLTECSQALQALW
jgi:hypothetical protein